MMTQDWSAPERDVMRAIQEHLDDNTPAMLATVVDVRGSAYRRPGAKMLVNPDHGGVGAITAGCLENEVRELARDVLKSGVTRVETFDLTGDDVWGMGIGCNGVLDILLEPLDETIRPAIDTYERGGDVTVATVVETDDDRVSVGDRMIADEKAMLPDDVATAIRSTNVERSHTTEVETDNGRVTVFLDRITAPAELVVLGTGHDIEPVVELAENVDFRVTVVGFRGGTDVAERVSDMSRVITTSPRSLTETVDFDEDTYVVVMTHNFVDDRLSLVELLDTATPYIGLMGPEKRFEEILDAFDEEGVTLSSQDRSRIYTPVGLDLGGGTPYQVAHSIIAEVLAVRNDRSGGHLRSSESHIHARADES